MTARSDREVAAIHGTLAVYPGTFDPFTPGHRDIVARARVIFDQVIVLLAVNADKRPTANPATRAIRVREDMPAAWGNVEVDTWTGLTAAYCERRKATVIVRGLRTAADLHQEYQLAAMNEKLGIQTVWLPARPELAATSSTLARAYRSVQAGSQTDGRARSTAERLMAPDAVVLPFAGQGLPRPEHPGGFGEFVGGEAFGGSGDVQRP